MNGIQLGDIVAFSAHAAYVTGISNGIVVSQVPNEGGPEQTQVSLSTITQTQGQPTGYWRKRPRWTITTQNDFSGGKVEVNNVEQSAPYTTPGMHWATSVSLNAVMDGRTHENYVRRFMKWQRDGEDIGAPKSFTVQNLDKTIFSHTYIANFKKEYNITFVNSFVGVGNSGTIKIRRPGETEYISYTLPGLYPVIQDQTTIEVLADFTWVNGIEYTFTQWGDGNISAYRTFTPTDHSTFTAYYSGKPLPMTNYGLRAYGKVAEPVRLTWNEHPNPNVTQYQIWRKVNQGNLMLLETLNRGTLSWTDAEYVLASGCPCENLNYDVRAYYSVEQTYANGSLIAVQGENNIQSKPNSSNTGPELLTAPTEYSITAYPNPFNPTTQIRYGVPEQSRITLTIFNELGQEVRRLVDGIQAPGYHAAIWNGTNSIGANVASGVYLYKLEAVGSNGATFVQTKKLLLLK